MPHSITVITRDSKSHDPSSILGEATMNNSITFKYNGKIWNPKNPEKKLKQLGITWDDVEIINNEEVKEEVIEYQNPKLYVFKNKDTGYTIESIYDNLDHLKDVDGYEYVGLKEYGTNSKTTN